MLNRSLLQRITYRQREEDNFCVLGSFGVAASAFTDHTNIQEYFIQHCQAFSVMDPLIHLLGWSPDPVNFPEQSYGIYMHVYYDKIRKINWYQAMEDLYNTRRYPLFETANENFTIEMINNAADQATEIELRLNSDDKNLVNLCLDWPRGGVHSITVGCDRNGFYTYDINDGRVVDIPPNTSLVEYASDRGGTLGNGMFFTQKTGNSVQ